MKKQEFLAELKDYLKILQDEEQEDILEEYSQHIEMKMENGLSEEEAIRDFGSVKELAAEILAAYHVKPEYEPNESGEKRRNFGKIPFLHQKEAEDTRDNRASSFAEMLKDGGRKAVGLLRRGAKAGKQLFLAVIRTAAAPFRYGMEKWENRRAGRGISYTVSDAAPETAAFAADAGKLEVNAEGKGRGWEDGKRMGDKLKHLVVWTGTGAWSCFCWCCRAAWNVCLLFAAGSVAFCGFLFLFLLGTLVVLWGQGYPLAGIVTGCAGVVLCCISLTVFGGTLFWKKQREMSLEEEPLKKQRQSRRMIRIVMAGTFCAGVLAGGIGTGQAFSDFSGFSYQWIGASETDYETQHFSYEIKSGEEKPVFIRQYFGGERCEIVEDESVPKDSVELTVVYNPEYCRPEFYMEKGEAGSSYLSLHMTDVQSGLGMLMKYKDEFLAGLKNRELREYEVEYVTSVTCRVNPSNREQIEFY